MKQQKTFALSASVSFPDHRKIEADLTKLARLAIQRDQRILAVYLFGSRANGNFSARSDADLLIIVKNDPRRPTDRIPDYLKLFLEAPVPVDVFPYTESEISELPFAAGALQNGRLLTSNSYDPS